VELSSEFIHWGLFELVFFDVGQYSFSSLVPTVSHERRKARKLVGHYLKLNLEYHELLDSKLGSRFPIVS
jgi:hypothetical protein